MTSRDYLSQEEIDALLKQAMPAEDREGPESKELSVNDYLTPIEQDALGEIGNITFGSAATALSTLLGRKVDITTPKVSAIAKKDVPKNFPTPHVAVHVNFVEGFHGINLLVIKTHDAQVIADLMLGGTGEVTEQEMNEIHLSAVQEAMNQMMGSAATSMSTIFNRLVNISPPGINVLNFAEGEGNELLNEDVFIIVAFRLTIGDLVDSTIMQLLPVWFGKEMVATLMGGEAAQEEAKPAEAKQEPEPSPQQPPMSEVPQASSQPQSRPQPQPSVPQEPVRQSDSDMPPLAAPAMRHRNVQQAQFADLSNFEGTVAENRNLNLLLDIPLKVTVELGRTQKQIKEILELSQGSVIELDKLAGEPVDILINNKLIAKGEVVVIDENFGVRVTEIANPWERIQSLQ